MTQVTVKELAQTVNTPVERLLQQMREAGLTHSSAEQLVSDAEKQALLEAPDLKTRADTLIAITEIVLARDFGTGETTLQ